MFSPGFAVALDVPPWVQFWFAVNVLLNKQCYAAVLLFYFS